MSLWQDFKRIFISEPITCIPPRKFAPDGTRLTDSGIHKPTVAIELGIFEGKQVVIQRGTETLQGHLERVFGDQDTPTLKLIDNTGKNVLVSYASIDEIREAKS